MPGWLVGCLAKKINNKFGLRLSVHFSHAIEFKCLQFSIFFFFFLWHLIGFVWQKNLTNHCINCWPFKQQIFRF